MIKRMNVTKVSKATTAMKEYTTHIDTGELLDEAFSGVIGPEISAEVDKEMEAYRESVMADGSISLVNEQLAFMLDMDDTVPSAVQTERTSVVDRFFSENAPEPKTESGDMGATNIYISAVLEGNINVEDSDPMDQVNNVLEAFDVAMPSVTKKIDTTNLSKLEESMMQELASLSEDSLSHMLEGVETKEDIESKLVELSKKPDGDAKVMKFFRSCISEFIKGGAAATGGAVAAGTVTTGVTVGVVAVSSIVLAWLVVKVATIIMKKMDTKKRKSAMKELIADTNKAIKSAEERGDKKAVKQLTAARDKVQSELDSFKEAMDITVGDDVGIGDGHTVCIASGNTVDISKTIADLLGKKDANDPISDTRISPDTGGIAEVFRYMDTVKEEVYPYADELTAAITESVAMGDTSIVMEFFKVRGHEFKSEGEFKKYIKDIVKENGKIDIACAVTSTLIGLLGTAVILFGGVSISGAVLIWAIVTLINFIINYLQGNKNDKDRAKLVHIKEKLDSKIKQLHKKINASDDVDDIKITAADISKLEKCRNAVANVV